LYNWIEEIVLTEYGDKGDHGTRQDKRRLHREMTAKCAKDGKLL
jgi:hypothetical protein